jgi:hypothetical protein
MAHKIVIEVDENGNLKSEVKGIEGASCTEIHKWLDELGEVEVDEKTADYWKAGGNKQTVSH